MSMFTQTTTERVDQLGPLSQTQTQNTQTHKTHKHTYTQNTQNTQNTQTHKHTKHTNIQTHKIQAHCAVTHRDLVEPRNWNKEFAGDRLDGRGHTGGAVQPEDLGTN